MFGGGGGAGTHGETEKDIERLRQTVTVGEGGREGGREGVRERERGL